MDQPKYRIEIFWSDEDGGYIATVPDLRYCSAFGETYEEALREVLEAMELHLDTLRELGRPIPEVSSSSLASWLPDPDEAAKVFRESYEAVADTQRSVDKTYQEVFMTAYMEFWNSMLSSYRSGLERQRGSPRN